MQRISDRIFGLTCIALAALIAWRADLIQESFIQDPLGPKAFPYVIAAVIALAGLAVTLKPDIEPHWPQIGRLVEIAAAIVVLAAYAQFLPIAGFVAATAVAAAYLSWRLGAQPVQAVLAGIAIAVGIYAVFHLALGLSLARGPWGF